MIIGKVRLTNFRSHDDYSLVCRKKTTLIVGENGSGKTSVLEAIYEVLRGKSFRATDREIVKRGEDYYRVELDYLDGERVVVMYDGAKKTFLVGGKKWARLPKKNRYPVVLFLPDDLHLVGASPGRRRDYFDRIIGELDDGYSRDLARYNKALKQKNEALKVPGMGRDSLFSWNMMLARYGCEIRKKRIDFIYEINKRVTEVYRSIAENNDVVELLYNAEEDDESAYLARLEANYDRDYILGHTSYGVHRDNFNFEFNGRMAEGSASRGEVRSIMLALKFIEAELLRMGTRKNPVVLLDDVFSELDEVRQRSLVKNFKDNQVIITSVEEV